MGLAGWLREARDDIRLQQTISEDAAEWEQHNKPGDRLYRGSQLKEARAWARRNIPSGNEVAFLHASIASRVRFLASIIAALLIVVSSIGGASWVLTHQPPDPTRVSTLQDNVSPGSLRYAVDESPPKSIITFDADLQGTILLTGGDLNIARDLEILGSGADKLSISGGGSDHIIRVVQGATVTISGLTFKDGLTFTGIIDNEGGTLTLNNSIVSDNTANHGGGIYNNGGTLNLNNSIISDNTVIFSGGGIYNNGGTLNLNNSIISDNTANGGELGNGSIYVYGVGGGGIYNSTGTLVVSNSILSGNMANGGYKDDNGGGIYNSGGMTILIKSTISGNTANGGDGGGIYNSIDGYNDGGMITLSDSTISDNTAYYGNGGGIFNTSNINPYGTGIVNTDLTFSTIYDNTAHGGDDIAIKDVTTDSNGQEKPSKQVSGVKIRNSIVASNLAHPGPDISGTLISSGYNLFQRNSGATFDPSTRTQHGTDKMVSVNDLTRLFASPVGLRNNGGSTKTLALAPDSPAVDQIPLAACHITVPIYNLAGTSIAQDAITTDQRGVKRPDGDEDRCDIGAYEYSDPPT